MTERLIIFTRYPEPGKTKTRLIPALGEVGAANFHRQMVEFTLQHAKKLQEIQDLSLVVQFTGGNLNQMQEWLGKEISYQSQAEGDLGAKMFQAFQTAFQEQMERVIIIGTDCPHLTPDILQQGFETLKTCEMVLGPALDGGYYLIGLTRPISEIFENIAWGTETVFNQTSETAQCLDIDLILLPPLQDIDRPEDLIDFSLGKL